MLNKIWFIIPLLTFAACSSDSSEQAASVPTTAAPATTTAGPSPSAAATTIDAPTTTAAPATTAAIEQSVAFETYGQQVTPIELADDRGQALVIYSSAKGDFTGDLTSTLMIAGEANVALVWFEGTASACGEGGLAIRIGQRPDGETGWEIVGGLGTGDLTNATGSGIETAPKFAGTISCDGPPTADEVSTTLLDPAGGPPPDPGTQAGTSDWLPVAPNPAQTEPATLEIAQVDYEQSVLFGLRLSLVPYPEIRGSDLLANTYVALGVSNDCSDTGVARVFIDNLLYDDFRTAGDVLEDAIACG